MRSSESPMLSISSSSELHGPFHHKLELGGYLELPSNTRSSSAFASYELGIRVNTPYMYAESLHGLGLITNHDELLGGRFQFFHDLSMGLRNSYSHIGIGIKHISSAGIHKPNIGRNYIFIRMGVTR